MINPIKLSVQRMKHEMHYVERSQKKNWTLAGFISLLYLCPLVLEAQCPNPIELETEIEAPDCHDTPRGKVTGMISGGTPPYTVILTGDADARLTVSSDGGSFLIGGLSAGNYTLTIRDVNFSNNAGCSTNESFTITDPPELILEVSGESVSCSGGASGSLQGKISGGTPPYTLLVNGAAAPPFTDITPNGTNFEISGLSTGSYFIRVIDANYISSGNGSGCTAFGTVQITDSGSPIETQLDIEICEGQNYQFGTQTLNAAGVYQETFTSSTGCDSIVFLTLAVKAGASFELLTLPTQDTLCTQETVSISVDILGGVPEYDILWYDNLDGLGTPLGSTETIAVNPAIGVNTYLTKVSDLDGCTVLDTSTITFFPIDVMISPADTSVCDDTEELLLSVINPDANQILRYNWQPNNAIISDPSSSEVLVDLGTTADFSVQVTNQIGCQEILKASISKDACAGLSISTDLPRLTPGEDAVLTVMGCEDCEYLWSSGQTESMITVTPALTTTYSVSITTPAGCACGTLEQTVEVVTCIIDPEDFFIPKAFTPDGDQINDELCVRSVLETVPSDAVEILLVIYNRWGQEVFRSTSFDDCWDGAYQGAPLPPDVYAYQLKVMCPGNTHLQKGDVMILL